MSFSISSSSRELRTLMKNFFPYMFLPPFCFGGAFSPWHLFTQAEWNSLKFMLLISNSCFKLFFFLLDFSSHVNRNKNVRGKFRLLIKMYSNRLPFSGIIDHVQQISPIQLSIRSAICKAPLAAINNSLDPLNGSRYLKANSVGVKAFFTSQWSPTRVFVEFSHRTFWWMRCEMFLILICRKNVEMLFKGLRSKVEQQEYV